jgi:hypothetical protein
MLAQENLGDLNPVLQEFNRLFNVRERLFLPRLAHLNNLDNKTQNIDF